MLKRFEQFIKERQYLQNVTLATVAWYRYSLRWLTAESPSQQDLNEIVIAMRQQDLKASACNSYARCINAYLHWNAKSMTKCGAGCQHPRIARMREEKKLPATFTQDDIKRFARWRPETWTQHRLQCLV